MSCTYSLQFIGLTSDAPEKLQRFKTICIADLELSVEQTQALLSEPQKTQILLTSESLPDITRLSELLTDAGATVAILGGELEPQDEEAPLEMTFDLEELLGEPQTSLARHDRPAKEYHLDLTDDPAGEDLCAILSERGSESTTDSTVPTPAPVKTTQPTPDIQIESLSFDEELPAPSLLSTDPISQLVQEVSAAKEERSWSDSDLSFDLGDVPEELPPAQVIKDTPSNSPLSNQLSASNVPANSPQIEISTNTSISDTPEIPSEDGGDLAFDLGEPELSERGSVSPLVDTEPGKMSHNQSSQGAPAALDLASALDAISFETILDDPQAVPPVAGQANTLSCPTPTVELEELEAEPKAVKREDDLPTPTTSATPQQPSFVPEPPQKLTPILPKSQSTTAISFVAKSADVQSVIANVPNEGVAPEQTRPRTPPIQRGGDGGFSKTQLGVIFIVGLAILVFGNWMLSSETEETTLPSIDAAATQQVTEATTVKPNQSPLVTTPVNSLPTFSGKLAGDGYEVTVSLTQQSQNLNTRVVITTPQPPEPTLEDIANEAPARIWLKRAESDTTPLKLVGPQEWSGTIPTYIFIERGTERRRLPGTTLVTVRLAQDGNSGQASIDLTYAPPGDTSLPAPGVLVDTVSKDHFRVSVTGNVTLQPKSGS